MAGGGRRLGRRVSAPEAGSCDERKELSEQGEVRMLAAAASDF